MSRCFPYPPPGSPLIRYSEAALIESIKLQKEKENDHSKKDKERAKRDKRKDKKYKDLSKIVGVGNGNLRPDIKGKFFVDESKAEAESIERSSLTEEHGDPVGLLVTSSSDSTEISNNRKRSFSPVACPPRVTAGKIIKIRLSKKPEQSGLDSYFTDEQLCTSAEVKSDLKLRECTSGASTSYRELHLKIPGDHEIVNGDSAKVGAGLSSLDAITSKKHKKHLQYSSILENLLPPPLQEPLDVDMDWLLDSRNESQKRQKSVNNELPCSASWPRAHYVPEIAAFALPYTFPF